MKQWYITADQKDVRYIKTFIEQDIVYDGGIVQHLCVTMRDSNNRPTHPTEVVVEVVDAKNLYSTKKEAQWEIMRRERFEPTV